MSKRNRAAAKAAERRRLKKARDKKGRASGDLIDRIAGYLSEQGFASSVMPLDSNGAVRSVDLNFRLLRGSGAADAVVKSRDLVIRVLPDEEEGCITVYVPSAWSFKGVSDQARARVFEALLDAGRDTSVGIRLHCCDGLCCPGIRIGMNEAHLPEQVYEAVKELLEYMVFFDAAIREALETGKWVEPEALEVDHDTLLSETQELICRVKKENHERLEAFVGRVRPVLKRIGEHDGCQEVVKGIFARTIVALQLIMENEEPKSACMFCPGVDWINEIFVVRGHATARIANINFDRLERVICGLEASVGEREVQNATTD